MKCYRYTAAATALLAFLLTSFTAWTAEQAGGFISVTPAKVKWTDAPGIGSGVKLAIIQGDLKAAGPVIFRIKFPPNTKIAAHTHPLTEHVTVLQGPFYFAIGDKFDAAKAKTYSTGSALVIPSGMPMFALTKDKEAIVQVHGVGPWGIKYLDPDEAPGKKK